MNTNNRFKAEIQIIWVAFWLILLSSAKIFSQELPAIAIQPSELSVGLNENFELTIEFNLQEWKVSGAQISIAFDPAKLKIEQVNLSAENPIGNQLPGTQLDNEAGILFIGSYGLKAANGTFKYAVMSFKAISEGSTSLKFRTEGKQGTRLSYNGQNVIADYSNCSVKIR